MTQTNTPTLYLIPTPLGNADTPCLLPHEQAKIIGLTDFVVEAEKTARAHLKAFGISTPIRELRLSTLNEHTAERDIPALLTPLQQGRSMGLLSEAGCPAVADPGAQLVALAHQHGFTVMPLVGPSSIIMALMASGANGQCFAFKGYLPADKIERQSCLKDLEKRARLADETQLFIETPYRNDALLNDAVATLHPQTRLCIATDLTLPTQTIISQSVADWRKMPALPILKKRPCLFVLYAHPTQNH
ncbi:SAM-dependent methyltransferase [Stenoxybacter acetivorans]|uniref:SAM-dependent methyltransferase n=1 Tax=Stenoxybacter acetivorans TaxID=422441 RepID=UPI00055DCC29|nr:SAM-dependent methyltransferase [Stenoxybacter acetivorans]